MSENDAISRIRGIEMPDYYLDYYSNLSTETYSIFEHAAAAKSTLVDSSGIIEPKIAFDLADRVAKMHEIDIAEPLREILKSLLKPSKLNLILFPPLTIIVPEK